MASNARSGQPSQMNIGVLGASGATGRLIVTRARERGHEVRAVVRRPDAIAVKRTGIELAVADVLDQRSLTDALAGCDAAVWAVGGRDTLRSLAGGESRQRGLCAGGTRVLLSAMEAHEIPRLVVISSWGVGDSRRRLPFVFRTLVVPLLLRTELADKQRQEELVRSSHRVWTIVRPSRLNDRDSAAYRVSSQLRHSLSSSISRRAVADFVVRCLDEAIYAYETVEITAKRDPA